MPSRTGPAPPSRRGRPRQHDEEWILDSAARALIARGYDALRYQDVSAEAGAPVPSLQHRFGSLDALRRAALRRKVRLELDELVTSLAGVEDPWLWVQGMVVQSISLDPQRRQQGWALWVELQHAAVRDAEMAKDARAVDQIWLDVLQAVIERGVRAGVFRPEPLSAAQAAVLTQALVDGLGMPLSVPDGPQDVHSLVDLLTAGVAAILRPSGVRTTAADS